MSPAVVEWSLSNTHLLAQVWAEATVDAQYCYPVEGTAFAAGVRVDEDGDESMATARSERLLVASIGSNPVGFAHTCAAEITLDEKKVACGIIRFMAFAPESPAVGQALLERAEDILSKDGHRHIDAFPLFHGYPFHNHKIGILSDRLTHISSLLLDNGYHPHDSHLTLVRSTDWTGDRAKPDLDFRIERDDDTGIRSEIILRAFRGDERIGICRFYSSRRYADIPDTEEYCYMRWIGVGEAYRRRGIGRYLLHQALVEMQKEGYKRTVLNCREKNTIALTLYRTTGYSTGEVSHAYYKRL